MPAKITSDPFGDLFVEHSGYHYRRVGGVWQMLVRSSGKWFACPPRDPMVVRQIADYENCLHSYGPDEGPEYPRNNKKGNVGGFFRELQARELATSTKRIFAPVRLTYDASAENRARFNREYSPARLSRNTSWLRNYLT